MEFILSPLLAQILQTSLYQYSKPVSPSYQGWFLHFSIFK